MSKAVDMFGIKQKIKENRQNIIINGVEDDEATAMLLDAINQTKEDILDVVLTKTNTTAYTPSAAYHPATKGYVDTTRNIKTLYGPFDFKHPLDLTSIPSGVYKLSAVGYPAYIKFGVDMSKSSSVLHEDDILIIGPNGTAGGAIDSRVFMMTGIYNFAYHEGRFYIGIASKRDNSYAYMTTLLINPENPIVYKDNVLARDNVNTYNPTGDYNPATKKYVDDAIIDAIGTALEASY